MGKNPKRKRPASSPAIAPAGNGEAILIELTDAPPRCDLTDTDFAQLLSALLSGWAVLAVDVGALRRAVQWWAANDEAWHGIETQVAVVRAALLEAAEPAGEPYEPGEPGGELAALAGLRLEN